MLSSIRHHARAVFSPLKGLAWSISFKRCALIAAFLLPLGCMNQSVESNEKVAYLSMRTAGPNSLDPVQGATVYDNRGCSMVYQTLLQYKYLKRPLELTNLLLAKMPEISQDGLVYHFQLREGVHFHDDPCFPDGKGRELVSEDVFYSLKRMADKSNQPKSWWLLKDSIIGFDEFREEQNAAQKNGGEFDYGAPVEGMKRINDFEFEIHLKQPFYRFSYVLAMFQTAIVPREAVEFYGKRFSRHPVGTGPYLLQHWDTDIQLKYVKNSNYWEEYYPDDPGLKEDGNEPYPGYLQDKELGFYEDAGKRLPILDRVEIKCYIQNQPKWLKFRNGELDYTHTPAENFDEAYIKRTTKLRKEFADMGIRSHAEPLLDMIYYGFNMEDKDFGGYDEKHKLIRQAIALAIDWEEKNDTFYNNLNIIYDGPIPPRLEGHPENHILPNSYRGPDLARARKLLEKAGHPNGKGLPKLVFYLSKGERNDEQADLARRQLAKIGIRLDLRLVDFSTLSDALRNRRAPFFSLAWGSDYPDAENNLQLFYGPYKSPSSNSFNYDRPEYNALYEKARVMGPSPERTKLYEQMRDMVVEDAPMIGCMARTRYYLIQERLKNFKPSEDFYNWAKYLNVE